jgi:polysaccharide export outer membrane protein
MMRKATLLLILGMLMIATSCVPTNKITYLQESKSTRVDSLMTARRLQPPYRLQVNDIVDINLKDEVSSKIGLSFNQNTGDASGDTERTGYVVDVRGEIRLPEIGQVKALGHTVQELREDIEALLVEKYFKQETDLFVSVSLRGIAYTMVGEVNGPGIKTVEREQINIIEALADGGGVPITGDLTSVKIIREYPDGVRAHQLDVTNLDVVYSPYFYVQPNDMIVVDPLPQKSLGTGTTGLSSFTTIVTVLSALVTSLLLFTRL